MEEKVNIETESMETYNNHLHGGFNVITMYYWCAIVPCYYNVEKGS